jgi:hypothetical protein
MTNSSDTGGSNKGNNPTLWNSLLEELDEKLQLGLLDKLRRIQGYHFEGETLILEAGTDDDESYLKRSSTLQQLLLYAQDATGVKDVKVKPRA